MRYAPHFPAIALAGAIALAAGSANAGNLYGARPAPLTWQGFYIGGNLGAAFDPNDLNIKDLSEEQDLTLQLAGG
jgi:hypothetical protein